MILDGQSQGYVCILPVKIYKMAIDRVNITIAIEYEVACVLSTGIFRLTSAYSKNQCHTASFDYEYL